MSSWKVKGLLLALAACMIVEAMPRDAQAGPIMDWLRGRRRLFRPVVAYSPGLASPCGSSCGPCQSCQMIPQTSFRVQYSQVPVTVYRPVTSYDPCTGCPVTTMRPCTSTTLVARRVPFTSYRQVCRPVIPQPACGCPTCPTVTAMPVAPAPCSTCPAPATLAHPVTPGCSSCAPPVTAAPQGMTPIIPQAPGAPPAQLQSPQTVPGTSGSPGTEIAPEFQQPQLQQGQGQGAYYPNNSTTYRSTGSYETDSYEAESFSVSPNEAHAPAATAVTPLPDLDRTAPPLLNPDDRSARLPGIQAGAIAPISWTVVEPVSNDANRWDDSGWQSAR